MRTATFTSTKNTEKIFLKPFQTFVFSCLNLIRMFAFSNQMLRMSGGFIKVTL